MMRALRRDLMEEEQLGEDIKKSISNTKERKGRQSLQVGSSQETSREEEFQHRIVTYQVKGVKEIREEVNKRTLKCSKKFQKEMISMKKEISSKSTTLSKEMKIKIRRRDSEMSKCSKKISLNDKATLEELGVGAHKVE